MKRVLRLTSVLLFALVTTATARAATEFKILLDTDRQAATGCTVSGMTGVERVVTATLDASQKVTAITTQECISGVLGTPSALDATGAASPFDAATGVSATELRLPLSLLGTPVHPARVGFVLTNGTASASILTDEDGGSIIYPDFPSRRRSENQVIRTIKIDGGTADWGSQPPLVAANASNGSNTLRFLNVFAALGTDSLNFRFDIQSNASAPTAQNDSYSTPASTALSVAAPGVLANDTDPNNKPLSATLVVPPTRGAVVLNPDGSFSYVPDGSANGRETFSYQASNGTQPSNVARVDIGVGTRPNRLPIAADDAYAVVAGDTLTVAAPGVLSNDTDPDQDPLTAHLTAPPAHGTLTLQPNGSFSYVSDGTLGVDTFKYRANDGLADSDEATVRLTVSPRPAAPVFTSPNSTTFYIGIAGTFRVTTSGIPPAFITETGTLPTGIVYNQIGTNVATLSGTAAAGTGGTYSITFNASNSKGTATQPFTITVVCPTVTITNPAVTTATAGTPFSAAFTSSGGVGGVTYSTASTLPAGLTLAANGTLSGTPTQTGTFSINVTATDSNGCSGVSPYTLIVACPSITVTPPGVGTATAGSPFNQVFTQSGAVGTATFTTASALPTGLALAANGTLSGTPVQTGTFNITVTATDSNGCTGSSPYTLVVGCQTISVVNPATASGTAASAFSQTFTQSGAIGTPVFSLATGTLPAGLTLAANGTLSGTPTQTGTFPITVKVTDANGCSGTGPTYTLVIACQTITVSNPASGAAVANAAFSQTFTQSGAIGTPVFSLATGTLPAGLTLAANGTLSGTPTQTGSFPITVKVTDGNGCIGAGPAYTITVACQTIAVGNPAVTTGTVSAAFSQTFTASNAVGTVAFTTASTLPAGLTLAANGTLAGTPTQTGTFPIVVTATDANGCSGSGATYNLVIGCQTITVTNPSNAAATVSSPFSETFTQTAAVGTATFTTASTLPAGLTLATNGTLSGTPTQSGTFPIVVTVTDANGCTGTSPAYNLIVACQVISVTNPSTATATVGTAFSQSFSQSGAIGTATFTTASALPAGLTLATNGTLSGTPTQSGTFPIVVTVTDANGCTGTGATYTLVVSCQTITVTNPVVNSGVAAAAFSQTFTQSGALSGATFTTSSTLPAGLTLSTAGVLSGTPTQTGSFPIVVTVTDGNGCTGIGSTYTLTITCQTITVTNPVTSTGTAGSAFSQTFAQGGAIGTATFTTASALPAGLSLSTSGLLAGTPTVVGTFPIVVTVTDSNGCTGTGATYNLVIGCQTINVFNPANATGTAAAPFSEQFTQSNGIGGVTFTTASTLPAGLALSSSGLLSGTPTQTGTFPVVVTVTDSNGCSGSGATYNLTINCQTIAVTNPANTGGTVSSPFSEQFSQSGAIGTATFTTASTLPTGVTLSTSGLLSGTPTVPGTFPIVVTVTDSNGCTGSGATYNLVVGCQTISVGNPATTSSPAGTPLSINFTQSGAIGGATFTTASTLPTGLVLATNGTLSGTPTQGGSFPIAVTVTDGNGCTGTNSSYTLTLTCPVITVTNPGVNSGTAGVVFSATFTQSGGNGTITWSESGALPAGITLNTATGVLSGTTTQTGSFPITVTATDQNGCQASGATYTLTISCQTITVVNPGVNTGTVDASFSQTFTATGILGTATWTETGALPAGLTLDPSSGVLSGTPTVNGVFPITVTATDSNGCAGTSSYTLTINCQTITVTNPVGNSGTVDAAFSVTFTQSGGHGSTTFSTSSTLPAGLTLSSAGVLSGTPTQTGSFPIVVTATDSNGCSGTGATYNLTINCQLITVTNPANTTGTVNAPFSETFTQSGAHASATFTTASLLPSGITLSAAGVLSGSTLQHGIFPIVVTVTDSNGCTGTGATYNLVINCQTITVTNPSNSNGTVAASFSEQFSEAGSIGGATFSTASTLPAGLTLSASGLLSGTPTQSGTFPINVTVADGNGCSGAGPTYSLVIACNTISVTNPSTDTGVAGTAFSATFTQTGGNGTITWSESGALPTGITLNTSTGELFGTTSQVGTFPITVTATDGNGCPGTGPTFNLTFTCQSITVSNPTQNSVQAGSALTPAANWTFTATGILGTAAWTLDSGSLPSGIVLDSATGVLSGSSTQQGSFPLTVRVTDSNGCFSTSSYTLSVTCPPISVTRSGGGLFPAAVIGTAYAGQSFTASGGTGPYTFQVTSGTFPPGLTLSSGGAISGAPTATGTFLFDVTATDASLCTGTASFSIAVNPAANADSFSNLVNNTEAVVTGGTTSGPTTPFVALTGTLIANDLPSGGVAANAGTFATSKGGSVTIAADGTFKYTPPVTASALTTGANGDSFNYTITSNSGATGTPTSATGTVTLNFNGRVWYVKNDGANGNGQSQSPFNSLNNFVNGVRSGPDTPGDIIFIYTGDGTTANLDAPVPGLTLLDNEQLIGQGFDNGSSFALVVAGSNLVATNATKPQITNSAGNVVTLANGNTVKGLTITGAGSNGAGIRGALKAGFTGDMLTVQNNTGSGFDLDTMSGTVTVTNSTVTGNGFNGVHILNGTAAVSFDSTNSISASTNAYSVSISGHTIGAIAIGATINDTGRGIDIQSNTSGTISFTGSQTSNNPSNFHAINLASNPGATISFSGTLNATGTTGAAFNATGGGTLNVTGTANLTASGSGTNVLNLNGMTIGGSGVTFTSVNSTAVGTAISLVNTTGGTVVVNGGTINNAVSAGIFLQGASTNLTLSGLTIGGTTGTGITNTTNFGTLTINAGVSVAATTALNLTGGTVKGTFSSVSSTGGTNGVNLNGVIVDPAGFGTTAGTLTGATGSTFKVTGGSGGTIGWGGVINQANGALAVDISGSNSQTINFSGNVTTSGSSAGISLVGNSGTYNFTGAASTIAGSGGGVVITTESGSVSFGTGYSITGSATSFKIGGAATATTANITFSGTINNTANGGVVLDINSASGTYPAGTIAFNGSSIAGSSNGLGGVRSVINNMAGTLVVNNLSLTSSATSFNNTLVAISASTGSLTFNHLTLSATGSGHTGKGLTMTGGGTLAITATGGSSSIDVSSTALDLNGVAIAASAIATLNSTGGVNGVLLTGCSPSSGGTLTISAGTIGSTVNGMQTGSAFKILNGNANVSLGAAITQNNVGQKAVDVSGITGGTIGISGAITSNGGTGISVAGTGGTVNFTGGMTLNGTTSVFSASGTGLTVNVTGTNTVGATTPVTTGVAVSISNATIGASNVTFSKISQTGGSTGIYLNNTGNTGGFIVTGDGATAGSGGTIQNTSGGDAAGSIPPSNGNAGSGVFLYNVRSVSLSWMQLNGHANYAIYGNNISTSFTLDHSVISGSNGTNDAVDEGSIAFDDLHGSATISNSNISGGWEDNLRLRNTTGSLNRLTISNTTWGNNSAAFGNAALNMAVTSGTPTMNVTVNGCTFTGSRSHFVQFLLNGTSPSNSDFQFTNNVITQAMASISGAGGVFVSAATNATGNLTYNIQSNTIHSGAQTITGGAINVAHFGTGTYNGTIDTNTIGTSGVPNSGSAQGNGITVEHYGDGMSTVHVTNNTVRRYNGSGIEIDVGDEIASPATVNLTVTGNLVAEPETLNALHGLYLNWGLQSAPVNDAMSICATIGGAGALKNTLTNSGVPANGGLDLYSHERFHVTVRYPGYAGVNNDNTAVGNFLNAQNTMTSNFAVSNNVSAGGGGYVGGAPCP